MVRKPFPSSFPSSFPPPFPPFYGGAELPVKSLAQESVAVTESMGTDHVIIWPSDKVKTAPKRRAQTCSTTPLRFDDLNALYAKLPEGGCIGTIHSPNETIHYLNKGFYGLELAIEPIPLMLSPDTEAFAIFGSSSNDELLQMAQYLANDSGFPVIVQSPEEQPTFLSRPNDISQLGDYSVVQDYEDGAASWAGEPKRSANNDEGRAKEGDAQGTSRRGGEDDDKQGRRGRGAEESESGGGGGGDGGGEESGGGDGEESGGGKIQSDRKSIQRDVWPSMQESHAVTLYLHDKASDDNDSYQSRPGLRIQFEYRFATQDPKSFCFLNDAIDNSMMCHVEVWFTKFQVTPTSSEISFKARSHGVFCLVTPKGDIMDHEGLKGNHSPPSNISKRIEGTSHQMQYGFSGGISATGGPGPTVNRTHGTSRTLESAATRVSTAWHVNYRSLEIGRNKRTSQMMVPVEVSISKNEEHRPPGEKLEVTLGMYMRMRDRDPIQEIVKTMPFIFRFQIYYWVGPKKRRVGGMIDVTHFVPFIQTKEGLCYSSHADVQFTNPISTKSKSEDPKAEDTAHIRDPKLSIGIASHQSSWLNRAKREANVYNQFARGWDYEDQRWRDILWPKLDTWLGQGPMLDDGKDFKFNYIRKDV